MGNAVAGDRKRRTEIEVVVHYGTFLTLIATITSYWAGRVSKGAFESRLWCVLVFKCQPTCAKTFPNF